MSALATLVADMETPPRYLTADDVAEWLKVSRGQVFRWIDAGLLPAVNVGSNRMGLRITVSDLRRFIDDRRHAQDAAR